MKKLLSVAVIGLMVSVPAWGQSLQDIAGKNCEGWWKNAWKVAFTFAANGDYSANVAGQANFNGRIQVNSAGHIVGASEQGDMDVAPQGPGKYAGRARFGTTQGPLQISCQ